MGLTDRVPGVLELDFVSIARPSSDTPPLTPRQFDRCVGRRYCIARLLCGVRLFRHVSVRTLPQCSLRSLFRVHRTDRLLLPWILAPLVSVCDLNFRSHFSEPVTGLVVCLYVFSVVLVVRQNPSRNAPKHELCENQRTTSEYPPRETKSVALGQR